jgi:hypothetical protein
MKKIIFIILVMIISTSSFSRSRVPPKLDTEMVMRDLDTIRCEMDTTFQIGKKIVKLMDKEVRTYGVKKTIEINNDLFLPFFLFVILYVIWFKNRKK